MVRMAPMIRKSYACAVCGKPNAITYDEACQGFDTCEQCVPRGKWEPYPDDQDRYDYEMGEA